MYKKKREVERLLSFYGQEDDEGVPAVRLELAAEVLSEENATVYDLPCEKSIMRHTGVFSVDAKARML